MKKLTTREFIEKAKKIHGNKYDYSKVEYVGTTTDVVITCPMHGDFLQKPTNHLHGSGCQKCGFESSHGKRYTNQSWIEKARTVHGDKYDYSKVEYVSPFDLVTIICPSHGEFKQVASYHLSGNGCRICGYEKTSHALSSGKEFFISQAKEVHGGKYDYSRIEYVNNKTEVCVLCPKHGEFWVRPDNHINNKSGCPKCNSSKLEESLRQFLNKNTVNFEEQKTFEWLINDKTHYNLKLDFYIPQYNVAIECQGVQHLEPIAFGEVDKEKVDVIYEKIIYKDSLKKSLCDENKVRLLYTVDKGNYSKALEFETYNEENTFYDLEKLFEEIKKVETAD